LFLVLFLHTHDVECDSCLCNISACLEAIRQRWLGYIGSNKSEADRYYVTLSKIYSALHAYILAEKCGDSTSALCTEITTYINSVQACCSATPSAISEEVIPISGGGGSGTTVYYNVWHTGIGSPGSGLGNNGDFYVCSTAGGGSLLGDLYIKVAGTWTYLLNMNGTTGAAGQDGVAVIFNPQGTAWLSIVSGIEQTLVSYNIPANTLSSVGDYLILKNYIRLDQSIVAPNISSWTYHLHVYLGTTQIAGYTITPKTRQAFQLETKISRELVGREVNQSELKTVGLTVAAESLARSISTELLSGILPLSFRVIVVDNPGGTLSTGGEATLYEHEVTKYLI
jgi:hypothetical protein